MSPVLLYAMFLTLGVIAFAFFEGLADGYAILNKTYSRRQKLSHIYNWLSRVLAVGAAVWLLFGFSPVSVHMSFYAAAVFWLVFEYTINWKLNRPPYSVGSNAWFDKQIRYLAQLIRLTPENFKRILKAAAVTTAVVAVLLATTGCHRQPQPSTELVPLPVGLVGLPIGAGASFQDGFFYTRINDSTAVKTSQPVVAKKIKIKNVGNVDVGKKGVLISGEGNTLDNSVTKDKSEINPEGSLIVGDGNTVTAPEEKKAIPWYIWLMAAVGVVAAGDLLSRAVKRFRPF